MNPSKEFGELDTAHFDAANDSVSAVVIVNQRTTTERPRSDRAVAKIKPPDEPETGSSCQVKERR
jgi:hypothetical protein